MRLSAFALSLAALVSPQAVAAYSPGGCGVRLAHLDRARRTRFVAPSSSIAHRGWRRPSSAVRRPLYAAESDKTNDDADSDEAPENPYADPNYPDLEFVNYDDPEYAADQGIGEDSEYYDESRTLAEIEAMREDRRRRNDEYQFETYHATVLRGGERSLGEWTVFQTDTFMGSKVVSGRNPDAACVPRLLKRDRVLKVVSQGSKVVVDPNAEWRVDGEIIVHEERLATIDDFPTLMMSELEDEEAAVLEGLAWDDEDKSHVGKIFWPIEMGALDFRGPGGNMCVGKAYTICDARPLLEGRDQGEDLAHEGPFREMRTELGVQENGMRFRVKLDYALLEEDVSSGAGTPPPLHLRTLTVCRETLDGYWPNPSDNEKSDNSNEDGKKSEVRRRNQAEITAALFGPPGAPGGLYDPPPVGSEDRAVQNYMLLDFEGGATVLLPHRLDQYHADVVENGTGEGAFGWVTSLDWTPGRIRYQVDRKVLSGTKLKGLRTLELSEVQSNDVERWRPKDGGANMRQ